VLRSGSCFVSGDKVLHVIRRDVTKCSGDLKAILIRHQSFAIPLQTQNAIVLYTIEMTVMSPKVVCKCDTYCLLSQLTTSLSCSFPRCFI